MAVTLGRTSWPALREARPVGTTTSAPLRRGRISTRLAVSRPTPTWRTSTRLLGVITMTEPLPPAASSSTAMTGTAITAPCRARVRLTSAVHAGDEHQDAVGHVVFGIHGAGLVRHLVGEAGHFAGERAVQGGDAHLHLLADVYRGGGRFR